MYRSTQTAIFFLKLGLVFVFTFAAITMSWSPSDYIHFIPVWVETIVPRVTALHIFSVYEILLSFWLVSGKKTRYAAGVSAITLAAITALNYTEFGIVFRNIAIICSALALAAMT